MDNRSEEINSMPHHDTSRVRANTPEDYYAFYPITDPAYAVIRISGSLIRQKALKYFSGKLIDIGCGKGIKRGLVEKYIEEYVGMDHESSPHGTDAIDLVGTAQNIPANDNTFDCALCTAVLEHLQYPQESLKETYRVLKHYFRYTRYGLEHLFESAGFSIVELIPLSGFWVTFGTEFSYYLCRFKKGILKPVVNTLVAFVNWMVPKLDRGILRDERFTWMYMVVARKP